VSFFGFGGTSSQTDPLLVGTTPAANGGPTPTFALQSASPAIDAGSDSGVPNGVTTDQRGPGFPRISGAHVDIVPSG
jgi:hypothetical protein